MTKYTLGVDYGTDSVRTVLVDTANGTEISSSVFNYPRWEKGKYCNPAKNQFRQHPLDYIEGLEATIKAVIAQAPAERAIVFTRTKHGADRLARQLGERGISAVPLHGDRTN